jgi:hypothetical protein
MNRLRVEIMPGKVIVIDDLQKLHVTVMELKDGVWIDATLQGTHRGITATIKKRVVDGAIDTTSKDV